MKKILSVVFTIMACVFLAWVALSWGEIIVKNLTTNPQYCPLNIFLLICK